MGASGVGAIAYRFTWSAFVTSGLLRRLADAAGARRRRSLAALGVVTARVLEHVGGLPLTARKPSTAQRTETAVALIHEAVTHVLREVRPKLRPPGYVLKSSRVALLDAIVSARPRVPLNSAGARRLVGELGLSAVLARRVVEERTSRGPFASLDDLDQRVGGIGPRTVDRIAHAIWLDAPADLQDEDEWGTSGFDPDLARLVSLQNGSGAIDRLAAALDLLATATAARPHPATREGRIRPSAPASVGMDIEAEWLGALFGADYYRVLPTLLAAARLSVDVCMFHVALPEPDHPTHRLLGALKTARGNGAAVRVLVDQDREEDPYHSTVINTAAKVWLEAAGIECRFDQSNRLLHSKFVVIDRRLVIIGSHNWSAGSYFQVDDLSVVVLSIALATQLLERFDRFWSP